MTPSIDIRLKSMMKSIEQIILPAIDAQNSLAQEQAGLLLGQLKLLQLQWRYNTEYLSICLRDVQAFARELILVAKGGDRTQQASQQLVAGLESSSVPSDKLDALIDQIAVGIDALLLAISEDGEDSARSGVGTVVLRHAQQQARRDRTWFASTGFDPDVASLGSVDHLIARSRQ
jgi:hypothetical protein